MNHSLLRQLSVCLAFLVLGLLAMIPAWRGAEANLLPVIEPLSDISLSPSSSADVAVNGSDPDGEPLDFSLMSGPTYASLQIVDDNHATIHIGPAPAIAERWTVSVQAADPSGTSDTRSFRVLIDLADGSPTAHAGGPYSSLFWTTIQFDASASADPDGQGLSYEWDFGDGYTASGPTPTHVYGRAGLFPVVLRVTDTDGKVGLAYTWAFQHDRMLLPVRAFVLPPDTHFRSGKPLFRVFMESSEGQLEQLVPGSVRLGYQGASIPAVATERGGFGDGDANGVLDYAAYFNADDVWSLLATLPSGRNLVDMGLTGQILLAGGDLDLRAQAVGSFRTEVIKGGRAPLALASFVRGTHLIFRLENAGRGTLHVFDVRGRLLRVVNEPSLSPGENRIDLGPRDWAAGVYFYRLRAAGEEGSGRFVITK